MDKSLDSNVQPNAHSSAELVPAAAQPPTEAAGATSDLQMVIQAHLDGPQFAAALEWLGRRDADRRRQAFLKAVATAKGEFPKIIKAHDVDYETKSGQRISRKYADINDVAQAVDPILAKHGLSYAHRVTQTGDKIRVVCTLAHEGGHSEDYPLEGGPDTSGQKSPNQAIASTITFLQRGTLRQALGLPTGVDDDGQGAPAEVRSVGADEIVEIETLIRDTAADLAKFLADVGAPSIAEMNMDQYKKGVAKLYRKKRGLSGPKNA